MLKSKTGKRTALALAVLLVQAGVYYTLSAKETIPKIAPWSQFPGEIDGWRTAADSPLDRETLAALQPDDYLNRDYTLGGDRMLNLFIGYFSSRRDGRAPHSPEWCLPGAGWKAVSTRVVQISSPGVSAPLSANEYIVDKGSNRELVVYWYHQGSHMTPSEVAAQLIAIPDMLMHGRTDTSLVRIIFPVPDQQLDGARKVAFKFASDIYPLIRQQIQ